MSEEFVPPGDCPVCGEFVPRGARSCRECGSDEKTGWSEAAAYDHLDLPEEAFDDDDTPRKKPAGIFDSPLWRWVALGVILVTVFLMALGWNGGYFK